MLTFSTVSRVVTVVVGFIFPLAEDRVVSVVLDLIRIAQMASVSLLVSAVASAIACLLPRMAMDALAAPLNIGATMHWLVPLIPMAHLRCPGLKLDMSSLLVPTLASLVPRAVVARHAMAMLWIVQACLLEVSMLTEQA